MMQKMGMLTMNSNMPCNNSYMAPPTKIYDPPPIPGYPSNNHSTLLAVMVVVEDAAVADRHAVHMVVRSRYPNAFYNSFEGCQNNPVLLCRNYSAPTKRHGI